MNFLQRLVSKEENSPTSTEVVEEPQVSKKSRYSELQDSDEEIESNEVQRYLAFKLSGTKLGIIRLDGSFNRFT